MVVQAEARSIIGVDEHLARMDDLLIRYALRRQDLCDVGPFGSDRHIRLGDVDQCIDPSLSLTSHHRCHDNNLMRKLLELCNATRADGTKSLNSWSRNGYGITRGSTADRSSMRSFHASEECDAHAAHHFSMLVFSITHPFKRCS